MKLVIKWSLCQRDDTHVVEPKLEQRISLTRRVVLAIVTGGNTLLDGKLHDTRAR